MELIIISTIICGILVGVLCGIITGLTPGVHINLVSALLLSGAPILGMYVPLIGVCVLIMSMAITHTFLDTLPSIFLGAPDDEKALGVLPGHRYLLRGNGLMAVKLCVVGGIVGGLITAVFFLPLQWAIELLYAYCKPYFFWLILCICLFTIAKDKKWMWASLIFCLSGIVGIVTLRLPLQDPLLPLLSGMFGVSTLLYSINEHQEIPLQRNENYTLLDVRKTIQGSILGVIAGLLTALFPGLSASAASSVASQGSKLGDHGFLVLLGSLGTASFLLSLAAYIGILKARNGAMAVIVVLTDLSLHNTLLLIGSALIACGMASIITLWLASGATQWLPKIPYKKTCIGVIIFVTGIVCIRCGWLGLMVLLTSTALGLLPAALKTARSQAMGCLLIPVLLLLW